MTDATNKSMVTKCLCGKPLHYSDKELQKRVEELIEKLGENINVNGWLIPRHYIALHGIKGADLENLAQVYDLKRA